MKQYFEHMDSLGKELKAGRIKRAAESKQQLAGVEASITEEKKKVEEAGFPTEKDKWTEVKVPFGSFVGTWRGMDFPYKLFDPSKIRRLGLLLADKKEGTFELRVDWIRPYGGDNTSPAP